MAVPSILAMLFLMPPRPDLPQKLADTRFLIEELAALATGVTAAYSVFISGIPGHSRRMLWLPLLPLAVWLGSLGQGCVNNWLQSGVDGLILKADWACLPAIMMIGAVPALVMALMIRRGAPLTPNTTVALGALAAGALANTGLRLIHPEDASLMILVWQFCSVVLLTALSGSLGPHLLRWRLPSA